MERDARLRVVGFCLGWAPVLLGASGCFNSWLNGFLNPTEVGQFAFERTTDLRPSISELEEPALLSGATDPVPEDLQVVYEVPTIKPDDVLTVRIFELLAPGTETILQPQVEQDGNVYIPVLGWLHVEGMTAREVQARIVDLTREREVLKEPEVSVSLIPARPRTFSIFGIIARPGSYGLPRTDFHLLEALNVAGGVIDDATWIYIYRLVKEREEAATLPEEAEPPPSTGAGTQAATESAATLWVDAPRTVVPAERSGDQAADPERELLEVAAPQTAEAPSEEPSELTTSPAPELTHWIYDQTTDQWISVPAGQVEERGAATIPGVAPTQPETARGVFEPLVGLEAEAYPENRIIAVPASPLRNGDPRYNLVVREGDTIRVMAGDVGEYFIMGHIARPGAYSLQGRRLTLKQALAAAGGMDALGWPDRCELIRRIGEDREQIVQVNLDRIFSGAEPDLLIKKNDIINVGTHPVALFLAVIRSAFRLTYGFGFVYDRNFGDIDAFGAQINPDNLRATQRQLRLPGLFP